ncbi:peptidylprolyl isomerase [Flavobacterium sp. CYK-4]|uniref:peptidylprolyl isomerase n=1 Tax=Flavobacterium lotistagni TaxID=2709660 RepID=UPI0014073F35|nr:peptidylprolyl isomerase [Flavobacterium lotistagni]NHM05838.1 peptidylprolyl isomerase [Flavobacterium lotistagni]
MAVLQKIRQRSLLLILVIGLSLLAFIVQDLYNKGGFNDLPKNIGTVNGQDIAFEDFRVKVSNLEKSGQQGMTPTQAVNRVWDQEVAIALVTAEFEKLGIRATEKHIMEVFKNDQSIGQNPMFQTNGAFDLAKFKEYFKSNPEQAEFVKQKEKDAELNAKYMVYNTLVKAGMYTTDAEGKFKYEAEANKVNFDYVAVLYSTLKDTDFKITDAEITEYMKKNEKKFKAEESREIEYVLIEDKASPEDEAEAKSAINALLDQRVVYNQATGKNDTLPGFKGAANTIEFVNENSDVPYDSTYVAKKDLPAEIADPFFATAIGEIYGPYMKGNMYCISKVMGRKAGANAKASHILISYEGTQVPNKKEKRTKEQAKAKAEQLLAQAKANPGNFFMLAMMNSDDSSAQQGGDLGYFAPGQMVKPFNDYVFNSPVGSIGLVETDFGFHVINVTEKQDAIRLATIARKIEPSEATSDKLYTKAVKFEMDVNEKDFEKTAKAANLTVNPSVKVKAMDESFGSVGNQRQVVRWAFEKETNVGDVKRFEVVNLGNVIVKLKKINEKGLMPVADARPSVEYILIKKKKAEKLKAKMKGSSLEAIATAAASTVQQAVDLTLENPNIPNAGFERQVVGTAFATGINKVSAPIEGSAGVFVVKPTVITKAPALKDHKEYVAKLKPQAAGYAGRAIGALKEEAKIDDNRARFNY